MRLHDPLSPAREVLLQDAILRDRTTARRASLLKLIFLERYLNREQLKIRVEGELGSECFGKSAWKDAFYRDIRIVKRALLTAGYELVYNRNPRKQGYYITGQPALASHITEAIIGSIAEVDLSQIGILRGLSPADRFLQGCSISDLAQQVVAFRNHQRNP